MRTGANGRIAVFWTQTELNGLEAAPLSDLFVGAALSWRGPILDSSGVQSADELDRHHARIELVNGAQHFAADLVFVKGEPTPVLLFANGCPERDQEFWINAIVQVSQKADQTGTDDKVVLFPTPQTIEQSQSPLAAFGVAAE